MKKILITCLATVFCTVASANALTPNDVIESAIAEISAGIDGRKDELREDRAALYELVNEILLPRFARRYAASQVLARHWRTADEGQRTRFIDAFYNSLLRKYAEGMLDFDPDRVEVLAFRGDLSRPRATARTIVRLDDGTRVPVNYTFVKRDEVWLMFDVTIEGVSYIRNYRSELDAEIRSSSLEEVITRFESENSGADGSEPESVASE